MGNFKLGSCSFQARASSLNHCHVGQWARREQECTGPGRRVLPAAKLIEVHPWQHRLRELPLLMWLYEPVPRFTSTMAGQYLRIHHHAGSVLQNSEVMQGPRSLGKEVGNGEKVTTELRYFPLTP